MQDINKTNLTRLREKSCQWAQYAGFDKKPEIENLIDINSEIKEAYEAREDIVLFSNELADIAIVCIRKIRSFTDFMTLYKELTNFTTWLNSEFELADAAKLKDFFVEILNTRTYARKLKAVLNCCVQNNIDIITICEEKLEYNYTRPEYKREVKSVIK